MTKRPKIVEQPVEQAAPAGPIYTITAAQYANLEHTAAVIQTVEAYAVLVGEVDTPELWQQMLDWGTPDDYPIPEAP